MGGNHLAKKKKINDYGTGIPQHEMEALARVLLPEIEKFYAAKKVSASLLGGKRSSS